MERKLEALYEECKELMLDSKGVVEEVEKYRQDCRPTKTRVVLLAESHAHTSDDDFHHFLKKRFGHRDGTRCRYVNFVYCVGNSESYALEGEAPIKSPTTQYWRILYSCLNPIRGNIDFHLFESGSSRDRVARKQELLNKLRKAGVWLLDASIIGINVLDVDARREVIRRCWEGRVESVFKVLEKEGLRSVVLIGKTVEHELHADLTSLGFEVKAIPQPQARLKGGYLPYYRLIHQTCQRYRL